MFTNQIFLKLDEFRLEIQRRDQEIMSMAAKMKTLEEQHQVSVRNDRKCSRAEVPLIWFSYNSLN